MTSALDCDYSIEGNGPPLFLIHGIGASRSAWRFLVPILRDHFTVVAYDLRGHGTSPMPSAPRWRKGPTSGTAPGATC